MPPAPVPAGAALDRAGREPVRFTGRTRSGANGPSDSSARQCGRPPRATVHDHGGRCVGTGRRAGARQKSLARLRISAAAPQLRGKGFGGVGIRRPGQAEARHALHRPTEGRRQCLRRVPGLSPVQPGLRLRLPRAAARDPLHGLLRRDGHRRRAPRFPDRVRRRICGAPRRDGARGAGRVPVEGG